MSISPERIEKLEEDLHRLLKKVQILEDIKLEQSETIDGLTRSIAQMRLRHAYMWFLHAFLDPALTGQDTPSVEQYRQELKQLAHRYDERLKTSLSPMSDMEEFIERAHAYCAEAGIVMP